MVGTAEGLLNVCLMCNHKEHQSVLKGVNSEGKFFSAAAQSYPPPFNAALAQAALTGISALPHTTCVQGPNGQIREPPGLEGVANPLGKQRNTKGGFFREPDHIVGDKVIQWDWKQTFSLTCNDPSHINLKEMRALRIYLRRRAKGGQKGAGQRVIILCDSRVVVGAVAHGRSPSKQLNRMLRKTLPILLGSGIYPIILWVPTGANPGDPPSRGACVARWLRCSRHTAKTRHAARVASTKA